MEKVYWNNPRFYKLYKESTENGNHLLHFKTHRDYHLFSFLFGLEDEILDFYNYFYYNIHTNSKFVHSITCLDNDTILTKSYVNLITTPDRYEVNIWQDYGTKSKSFRIAQMDFIKAHRSFFYKIKMEKLIDRNWIVI